MPSSSMAGAPELVCRHQATEPGLLHGETIMHPVTSDAIKGIATITTAALASCTTWLVGMLAIMTSPVTETAHAMHPLLLA